MTRGHPGLGDQGSSFLKDQMLIFLSPTAVAREVFIGLFMDRLPVEMRAGLSQTNFSYSS